MAENRQKLIHLHSASVKVPNAGVLAKGEIAVQYAANDPALYIEKTDGAIAKFIDEAQIEELVSAGIASANTSAYEYADDAAESALTAANNYADALVKDEEGNNLFDEAGAADEAYANASAYTDAQIAALKLDETYAVKAVEGRVDDLEAISADTRLVALEDDSHVHANKDILDAIDADRVAAWDASGADAKDYIDGIISAYTNTVDMEVAIEAAADEAYANASAYTDAQIEALKLDENYEAKGTAEDLLKAYATSADTVAAIEAVDGKFANYATSADTVAAIEAVNTAATEALKAYATSADTVAAIEAVDGKFANYATSANTVAAIEAVDGKFANYATSADTVAAIEAAKDARVDTLVGEDADMSVRNIAADEASKAMANVVSGAPEAFDTLKEIADWIGDGAANTTAAQMVTDIAGLKAISADTRIEALEALSGESHTHDNKALLDTYTQTEANLADAVAKKHEHENADVLDGISAEDVAAWDEAVEIANGVEDAIADALSAASEDAAAQIAALKLDETYAVKAVEGRVDALEALSAGSRLDAVEEVVGDLEKNFDEAGAADAAFSAATADTAAQIEALGLGSAAQADVAEEDIVSGSTDDGLVSAAQVAKYVDDELAKVAEVADNALVEVVTASDTTSASISASTVDNVTTLDFSEMIIDCGEY